MKKGGGFRNIRWNNNLLLTAREGRTGEYWTEVVTVRTGRSEICTKMTEGQYSTVRLEQARLVSCLLYGSLFLIVKCTSGGLHLKMFAFSIHLWNFGKISIFLASSGSFNVKNDNIHTFFFAVLVANFEFAVFAPKQKYTYCKILTEKEPIRAQGFAEDWVCHIINCFISLIQLLQRKFNNAKRNYFCDWNVWASEVLLA